VTESSAAPGGTIALVGAGEFLPAISEVDRLLLSRVAGSPRVAIVSTAAAPDGRATYERWLRQGVDHFTRLGVPAEAVDVFARTDAESDALASRIAASTLVYLSGGKPGYLRDTLKDTLCWQAIVDVFHQGGVIAGCSAGAMVLVEKMLDFPRRAGLVPGLNLAPGLVVLPHFGEFPLGNLVMELVALVGGSLTIVGIEGTTALIGTNGGWEVAGRGGVTVLSDHQSVRYTTGQRVEVAKPATKA
jgi:cyanophycinase-like exopeptidase